MMNNSTFWIVSTCLIMSRLLLVHGSSAIPEEMRKMTAGIRKKCIAETQVAIEDIENTEDGHFPDDDRLKCYFKCAFEKFNLMDKNGEIKFELMKKAIPEDYREIVSAMIDSCVDVTGKDKCEKAYNYSKCMYDANPVAFMAP